jgi:hypothetical protein
MPTCSLNCSFYDNLKYGSEVNSFITENKCKKCGNFTFEGCYDICHRCCDIFCLEFIYQHQNCIEATKHEINYENVIDEIKKLDMTRKDNGNSIYWNVKLNNKNLKAVNCDECGEYMCMKKSNKYPKNIFCNKCKFIEYGRRH